MSPHQSVQCLYTCLACCIINFHFRKISLISEPSAMWILLLAMYVFILGVCTLPILPTCRHPPRLLAALFIGTLLMEFLLLSLICLALSVKNNSFVTVHGHPHSKAASMPGRSLAQCKRILSLPTSHCFPDQLFTYLCNSHPLKYVLP